MYTVHIYRTYVYQMLRSRRDIFISVPRWDIFFRLSVDFFPYSDDIAVYRCLRPRPRWRVFFFFFDAKFRRTLDWQWDEVT